MSKFIINRVTSAQFCSVSQTPGVEGELLLTIDTNKCYTFHNNCWIQLSDGFKKKNYNHKLTPMICKQCGAPRKSDGVTDKIKCEYCDTAYRIS